MKQHMSSNQIHNVRAQNLWLRRPDFIWNENRQEKGLKATCSPPLDLKLQLGCDEEINCRFWWSSYLGFSRSPSWLRLPLLAALSQTLKALPFTLSAVKTLSFLFLSTANFVSLSLKTPDFLSVSLPPSVVPHSLVSFFLPPFCSLSFLLFWFSL